VIRTTAQLVYCRNRWRYSPTTVEVCCDAEGCAQTVIAKDVEHNGAEVEAIYLPTSGWTLGERDFCPAHASTQDIATSR
jgi:hypothetical protein